MSKKEIYDKAVINIILKYLERVIPRGKQEEQELYKLMQKLNKLL